MAVYINGPWISPSFWYRTWCDFLLHSPEHAVSVCLEPPTEEPFTLTDAKLRANLTWADGDPRDELMKEFIAAARGKVERDTGLSILTQTRAVYFDAIVGPTITLPWQSMPVQSVESIVVVDNQGVEHTLDEASYVLLADGRIIPAPGVMWPSNLRTQQAWMITIVSGWPDAETLAADAPALRQAIGLLIAHYATLGRDLAMVQVHNAVQIPHGYEDILSSYLPVVVP